MASQHNRRDALDALAMFHPAIGAWFRSSLGEPTRAQTDAWPPIARGESTLLFAPTGSGKTLAAFLWAIDKLVRRTSGLPSRVLYISPLKALAVDIEHNLRAPLVGIAEAAKCIGQPICDIVAAVRTGDTKASERTKMRRVPPDILITTPESLYLLLTSRQRDLLASVDTVIVDEIHQMVPTKRGAHLFVSLERLEALRHGQPLQRIGLSATQKPLDEVARMLGGFETKSKRVRPTPRPVTIVDANAKKAISITVEAPPPLPDAIPNASVGAAPCGRPIQGGGRHGGLPLPAIANSTRQIESGGSVWPKIHAYLIDRIGKARSTMIFVNSRRLAERLAAAINDRANREIALAHHGSVAKDTRRIIEERLKAGELPAIVATSSLELGIDMGAVDQVIQVEAPPSIASGIQRIGRASHHVGGVPTGVIVPKHPSDLLACAAAAAGIESGDVEETFYARSPLDVLAQQIVAIASIGIANASPDRGGKESDEPRVETSVEALWDLVRGAAPFAELPRASFDSVLDMLSGHSQACEWIDLRPRITWDRKHGVIHSRHGALRLAILNGGTIPDRGLFGVFLAQDDAPDAPPTAPTSRSSRRVGELDEEMVFELREGEVFLLGASSWRTERIGHEKVIVTPAPGVAGKMPFWHGDRAGRSFAFGMRIGKLARDIEHLTPQAARAMLTSAHCLDARSAASLAHYVQSQAKSSGVVPTDRTLVVEHVMGELGDRRICVLSPFGNRVHAPWAMAVRANLRAAGAGNVDVLYTDDGLVLRLPEGATPPSIDLLFPSPDEIADMVTRELGQTSLFAARFREAAARALLLPRRSFKKRTPLWAQRKRSSDLLSAVSHDPSFPIVLETYRECLKDTFDMPALTEVLRNVASKKIRICTVDRPYPSPFAASLLFSFVGNFIYDADAPAAERRAHALTIDQGRLFELLGETEVRKLLDPDVLVDYERSLSGIDHPLRHADALADLLLRRGDMSQSEIALHAEDAAAVGRWLSLLLAEGRALRVRIAGEVRFVAIEDAGRYRSALGIAMDPSVPDAFAAPVDGSLTSLIARHARTRGPFTAADLAKRWAISENDARAALEPLARTGKVVQGAFRTTPAAPGTPEYCDAEVLRALKHKTLAKLRKAIRPASASAFARFLSAWQNVISVDGRDNKTDLISAIAQLEGCPLPASVLETEILPARVPGYCPHHLDMLLASGKVVWAGIEPIGHSEGRIALYLADHEALLARAPADRSELPCSALHDKLRELLTRRGALFFGEIARALGAFPADVQNALWDLVWAGEVTNDTFEPLRSLGMLGMKDTRKRPHRARRRVAPTSRFEPRGGDGRWSLRQARLTPAAPTEHFAAVARALLERYGVVLREAAQAEGIAGGFPPLYEIYRTMEDQGRVRRGYFVADRGALQFALPGAAERLREPLPEDEKLVVLAATDPANPYGALLAWPSARGPRPQRAPGARVVLSSGRLVAWLSRSGRHLATFLSTGDRQARQTPDAAEALANAMDAIAQNAQRDDRAIFLATIDEFSAPDSPFVPALLARGFRKRMGLLVRLAHTDAGDRGALEDER
ncbi:MAG: DEAD/DEAH box helicase [Polyangiaceae bacterium]|nr:DEAD/DEAH box helicase [Polyangiaceae bacterium]